MNKRQKTHGARQCLLASYIHFVMYNGNSTYAKHLLSDIPDADAHGTADAQIVDTLIAAKADVDKPDDVLMSPLHWAAASESVSVCNVLVKHRANVNALDVQKQSPLYFAATNGCTALVGLLLQNKAAVNHADEDGVTALLTAVEENNVDTVSLLLENQADVDKSDVDYTTPLMAACSKGHNECVLLLLQHRAAVNKIDITGATPLYQACSAGHDKAVQVLLGARADVNTREAGAGWTPLFAASWYGHSTVVQHLVEANADINKVEHSYDWPPLLGAVHEGNERVVSVLVNANVNVNQPVKTRYPLSEAASKGYANIVKILLRHGAHVELGTPLVSAAKCSPGFSSFDFSDNTEKSYAYRGILATLLKHGADVNQVEKGKRHTSLSITLMNGDLNAAKLLMCWGGRVDRSTLLQFRGQLSYILENIHRERHAKALKDAGTLPFDVCNIIVDYAQPRMHDVIQALLL